MLLQILAIISLINFTGCLAFNCYSCQGGLTTPCAVILPRGMDEICTGINAQCYEAIKMYQNGAMLVIERRCWVPDENSTSTNYCEQYSNPVGVLLNCRTCMKNLCNNSSPKDLLKQ